MNPKLIIQLCIGVALALCLYGWGVKRYHDGVAHQKAIDGAVFADIATAARESAEKAHAAEIAAQRDIATLDQAHQLELRHAQDLRDATAAALRAGTLQLQDRWADHGCPNVPGPRPTPRLADAAPDDREQGAGALVQVAAEADATQRALQRYAEAAVKLCAGKPP